MTEKLRLLHYLLDRGPTDTGTILQELGINQNTLYITVYRNQETFVWVGKCKKENGRVARILSVYDVEGEMLSIQLPGKLIRDARVEAKRRRITVDSLIGQALKLVLDVEKRK